MAAWRYDCLHVRISALSAYDNGNTYRKHDPKSVWENTTDDTYTKQTVKNPSSNATSNILSGTLITDGVMRLALNNPKIIIRFKIPE